MSLKLVPSKGETLELLQALIEHYKQDLEGWLLSYQFIKYNYPKELIGSAYALLTVKEQLVLQEIGSSYQKIKEKIDFRQLKTIFDAEFGKDWCRNTFGKPKHRLTDDEWLYFASSHDVDIEHLGDEKLDDLPVGDKESCLYWLKWLARFSTSSGYEKVAKMFSKEEIAVNYKYLSESEKSKIQLAAETAKKLNGRIAAMR